VSTLVAWIELKPRYLRFISQREFARLLAECQTSALPANLVTYTTDPTAADRLCAEGQYLRIAIELPDAARILPPWQALAQRIGVTGEGRAIFCHARRSPAGHERLVVVTSVISGIPLGHVIKLASGAVPCVVLRSSELSIRPWPTHTVLDKWETMPVTLYAGQADQQDASHFTIGYSCAKGTGVMDGWLLDDDRLRFRALSGPCKQTLSEFEEMERASNDLESGVVTLPGRGPATPPK
jgi:hypothetical protein